VLGAHPILHVTRRRVNANFKNVGYTQENWIVLEEIKDAVILSILTFFEW
jgi:hypothetical protein